MRRFLFFLAALGLAQVPLPAALPTITNQPASQAVWAGVNATFDVGVTGAGPFSYQWLYNGTILPTNVITTVAGGGIGDGAAATNANLWTPSSVAVDTLGNIYIADQQNDRIRKVGTNGVITTVAGNGQNAGAAEAIRRHSVVPKLGGSNGAFSGDGGPATNASLYFPCGVLVDTHGNLFIADQENNRIRKIDTNGIITTFAGNGTATYAGDGGAATNASLSDPTGVALDIHGNLFIADYNNNCIRKVGTNGIISTFAGTNYAGFYGDGGPATNAWLSQPRGVALDTNGNLYIADLGNQRIRKVNTNGIISTLAGTNTYGFGGDGGPATNGVLYDPSGVTVDAAGDLLIADDGNSRIRKISANGIITTVAGTNGSGFLGDGGLAVKADLGSPLGTAVDTNGNLFIADTFNFRIRKVNATGIISTVAGNGSYDFSGDGGAASKAAMGNLSGVAVDAHGNVFIADEDNARIRKVDTNNLITTVAGNGIFAFSGDNGAATNASLNLPYSVALDAAGKLYIADWENYRVRMVATNGVITTYAGNGTNGFTGDGGKATNASFGGPSGVVVDAHGNLFVADPGNLRVRKVGTNGIITTYAGNGAGGIYGTGTFSGDGGAATNAGLSDPCSLAVDAAGNLFIADGFNYRIRRVGTNGVITTVAGNGVGTYAGDGLQATNASLDLPYGVAVDASGDLFIADSANQRIRKVDTNGIITTLAGNGTSGYSGDGGAAAAASLSEPDGVAVDASNDVFIADSDNRRVREVTSNPQGPVLALNNVSAAGAGEYQVVVTDSAGSVTSSVAIFTVTSTPIIYQSVSHTNGSLTLGFVSQPGSTNVVLGTTNLAPPVVWLRLSTNLAAASGDWLFTDTNINHYRARYYRSLTPTPP